MPVEHYFRPRETYTACGRHIGAVKRVSVAPGRTTCGVCLRVLGLPVLRTRVRTANRTTRAERDAAAQQRYALVRGTAEALAEYRDALARAQDVLSIPGRPRDGFTARNTLRRLLIAIQKRDAALGI